MEDQKQRVYDALNKMGIKYEVVEHEPVHTMEDMDRLIAEAKKREMYILMDLVVNHCSDEHEWFQQAIKDPDGKYGNFFYIRDKNRSEGTGKTAWGRNIKLCFRRTSGKISWCKTGKRYTFCPDERYGTCGGILYR